MINLCNYVVFDFETTSKDPSVAEPWELAAVVLCPRTLNILDSFESRLKIMNPDKVESEALSKCKITIEEISDGPHPQEVWRSFVHFLSRHEIGNNEWGRPIPCGHNLEYDLEIASRLHIEYSENQHRSLFHPIFKIDTLQLMFMFFENSKEPYRLNMDSLSEFLGLETEGHRAMIDVQKTAMLFSRFQRYIRKISNVDKFRGAFRKS